MRRPLRALPYAALLADVVLFFHKPLFSLQYLFPWDFRGVQLPMISFLADQLRQNRWATWNPFSYCGYPIFANIEACFFHPLVFLTALVSSRTSPEILPLLLEWIVVLQVWVAGIAAYRLFQEMGAGRIAAWTGAAIFQTGGFFASRAEHIGAMMAVAWMPLCWLALFRLREGLRPRWLAALAAGLGMAIVGGFPQPTLAVYVSTAALAIALVAFRLARLRLLAYTACGCVLGILLASAQFIPTTQLTGLSVAKYRADWLGTGGGLHWQSLVSLILPNYYHIFDLSKFTGPGDPTFLYFYCSIGGLLLALFALVASRNRFTALLAVMALFGLLWTLGDQTPVWRWFYPLLPEKVRIGIHPEYAYSILTLAIAGLAALGLDRLHLKPPAQGAIAAVIAVDLFLVGSGRPMNCVSVRQEPGVTRQAFEGSAELLNEVRSRVYGNDPPWRVDTVDGSLFWAISGAVTGVPSASGVSPLALENIIQLRLFLHDGARSGWYYPVDKLDSPVLDLLNVKYLIVTDKAAGRVLAAPKFRRVSGVARYEIFENLSVMPRFFLVHDARPAASLAEARGLIERREIDLRRSAITDQPMALSPPPGDGVEDVKVLEYRPASLELAVQSRGASLLVLAENYYPGWRAWLDGQPAPIHRADLAFRAIAVPDGAHRLRMEFRPAILPISAGVSALTALFLLLLARRKPSGV